MLDLNRFLDVERSSFLIVLLLSHVPELEFYIPLVATRHKHTRELTTEADFVNRYLVCV